MLGVLIADDEMIARCGIRSMIDWEKFGLRVAGEAANGKEALELFSRLNPEIVITDIKMPLIDGIELIKAIRSLNRDTKIIILSCYQDFNYAREAIRLGATEYLIKSDIMPSDLEALLQRVKEVIDEERARQVSIAKITDTALKNNVFAKERFLWELSLGIISKTESFADDLKQLGINYFDQNLVLMCVGVNYFEKITHEFSESKKKEMLTALESMIKQILDNCRHAKGETYPGNSGEINVLVKICPISDGKNIYDSVRIIAETMIERIQKELGFSVNVGLSDPFDNLTGLKQAYSQAQQAYKYKMFFGCGKVIHFAEAMIPEDGLEETVRVTVKKLQDNIYYLKRDQVQSFLKNLFDTISRVRDYDQVNLISLELVLVLNNIYAEVCKDNERILQKKKEYYEQIKYLETLDDIRSWFQAEFAHLMDYIDKVYHDDQNIIMKAVNYINNNYNQEISLSSISEYVHLSRNYFANLFKRQVGESFVEYLTKFRIEKAKLLLQNPDLKVYDIGYMVGIGDSHYFSKVFKKITGLTPTEYKDLYRETR